MRTNETGHYKNVVGLTALKVFAEGLGAEYNPQKETLKLANLILFTDEANALHNAVKDQTNTVSLTVDNRQMVYENVKPLSTKVINTMSSTDVSQKTIEDAKFFHAKIQGVRIGKKSEGENGSNSVSRQSYDSIYENLGSLNNLLIQDGRYNPVEDDVNIAGLTLKLGQMQAANGDIARQLTELGKRRVERNNKFYVGDTCLIAIGREIKKYIRGKYGAHSPEFAQIKNITFRDYGKK